MAAQRKVRLGTGPLPGQRVKTPLSPPGPAA